MKPDVDLISPEYMALLKRQHKETIWGSSTQCRNLDDIDAFAESMACTSIVDYGCGLGALAINMQGSGIKVHNYDPGTVYDALPPSADMVVCTDVLEHVEPACLDNTMAHIFAVARKAVYLLVATRQAKAKMVDGSEAHLVVENAAWWFCKLHQYRRWKIVKFAGDAGSFKVWLVRDGEAKAQGPA